MAGSEILDLKCGLKRSQIVPYFQPQVDLRNGQICRFEALARWRHPVHGLIGPDVFIPLAEAADLIGALTNQVVAAAAEIATGWPESVKLAVNVSPVELRDWSLPDRLQAAVDRAGFPMERLIVEVTEAGLVGNLDLAQAILADLKDAGATLALDDFGTGCSSLHHLQAIPFGEIKVDGSFIRRMGQRPESRKLVAAIVGLGASLGLTTVAEAVEEQTQADMLVHLGCDFAQGWLFGRPVPPENADEMIGPVVVAGGGHPADADPLLEASARPAELRARLQATYDGAPIGLCFVDRSLRCVHLNRNFAELHGLRFEPYPGRHIWEILPALQKQLEPWLLRGLAGEESHNVELQVARGKASCTVLLSFQPARDEAGNVFGMSISALDVYGS